MPPRRRGALRAAARLSLLGVVAGSSVLGATLAALPALAVGLLVLFDTGFGSTLAVLRALVEPFLWPGAGASGVMHVRDLMAHPALAAAWSAGAAGLAAAGLAAAADRRAGWWWALAAWGASAAIGGEAVGVVLVPAGVARLAMAVLEARPGSARTR
ncbi:MAG: hypothetical protein ACRYG6_13995 [Janthinobacterium lividum]